MKKLLLGSAVLLMLTGCSGKNDSSNSNEANPNDTLSQTITTTDTTASQQIAADPTAQNNTPQVDVDELYENGLVLSQGKKSEKIVGDNTDPDITLPVTITNNTGIDLNPEDYIISYKVSEMYADGSGLDSRVRSATQKGPKIANGESVTIKLFQSCVLDIKNPKAKLKIDKEKFAERLNEAK